MRTPLPSAFQVGWFLGVVFECLLTTLFIIVCLLGLLTLGLLAFGGLAPYLLVATAGGTIAMVLVAAIRRPRDVFPPTPRKFRS